jgi:acyl-coenzyme A thioesterase 13
MQMNTEIYDNYYFSNVYLCIFTIINRFLKMSEEAKPATEKTVTRLEYMQSLIGKSMQENFTPVGKWLNGKLLAIQEDSMTAEYVVREDMTNPMRVLHGGIAATMLDDVIGTLVFALGREFAYTTVNLNCDFLNAAKSGEVITAQAKIVRAGKNIIHVEGAITNDKGMIIAKCSSNLIQTSLKISF